MLDFLFFLLALMVGLVVGATTIYQSVVIFRFGLPMVSRLIVLGFINSYKPIALYLLSLIVFLFILSVSTTITLLYFPNYKLVYLMGLVFTFLAGDRKVALERESLLAALLENDANYLLKKIDEDEYKSLIPHTIAGSIDEPMVIFMETLGFAVVTPIFYGIGVILVVAVLNWSRWLGLALFGIGTLVRVISLILFIVSVVGLMAKLYLINKENNKLVKASFIVSTLFIKLVEQAIYFFYFIFRQVS
ncbi:MAG: hypothetical protein FD167_1862 [bacterium]|nr:MAG: hypothetical protein FD167_1862 [bacterium]